MTEATNPSAENQDPAQFEKTSHTLGAGVIFYIKDTQTFLFFRRTMVNESTGEPINYPGWVDVIGGRGDEGESDAREVIMREIGEELVRLDGPAYQPAPEDVELFADWTDERGVHLHIYGCVLETMPDVTMVEGAGLVALSKDELASTEIAFGSTDVARNFASYIYSEGLE